MRRRYTREEYLDLVDRCASAVPDIALSTDMIVGFPGETAEDFELTLTSSGACASTRCSRSSTRRGRTRWRSSGCPTMCRKRRRRARIVALQALQRDIQTEWHRQTVGRTVEVLVEAPSSRRRDWELSGRTTGNTVVNFPGRRAWIGRARAGPASRQPAEQPARRGRRCRRRSGGGVMLDRDDDQGADGRPGHEHADRASCATRTSERVLPIWVGPVEANAIALQIENVAPPRPMTHDLLRNVIDRARRDAHARRHLRPAGEHVLRLSRADAGQ